MFCVLLSSCLLACPPPSSQKSSQRTLLGCSQQDQILRSFVLIVVGGTVRHASDVMLFRTRAPPWPSLPSSSFLNSTLYKVWEEEPLLIMGTSSWFLDLLSSSPTLQGNSFSRIYSYSSDGLTLWYLMQNMWTIIIISS